MSQDQFVTLNQVVHHLRQNRHEREATTLEQHLADLSSDDQTRQAQAADSIIDMCSVRVLGHTYINELTLHEWYRLLDQLADSVRPYRKRKA